MTSDYQRYKEDISFSITDEIEELTKKREQLEYMRKWSDPQYHAEMMDEMDGRIIDGERHTILYQKKRPTFNDFMGIIGENGLVLDDYRQVCIIFADKDDAFVVHNMDFGLLGYEGVVYPLKPAIGGLFQQHSMSVGDIVCVKDDWNGHIYETVDCFVCADFAWHPVVGAWHALDINSTIKSGNELLTVGVEEE